MVYDVKLPVFEGPLDLLLHLIHKNEVDIYDIPIARITEQYLDYLYYMQELQLEIASEFLVMASTLLHIKSRMLLPRQEEPDFDEWEDGEYEEIDPREELVQRLLEYKKYKEVAEQLREKEAERSKVYTRPAEDLSPYMKQEENPVKDVTLYDLIDALQKLFTRAREKETVTRIERDEISVQDRMQEIVTLLRVGGGRILFTQIFDDPPYSRTEIVTTLLALLELMKKRWVYCEQNRLFDDILIHQTSQMGDESSLYDLESNPREDFEREGED